MKSVQKAVSIVTAIALVVSLAIFGNVSQASAFFEPTEWFPRWGVVYGEGEGGYSGEFDQELDNDVDNRQKIVVNQEVKCEHVENCRPTVNIDATNKPETKITQKPEQEYEGSSGHDNIVGELDIFITYDEDADEYGEAVLRVNNVDKKFDMEEKIKDADGDPVHFDYYFYDYYPDETEVCIENAEIGEDKCKDVYSDEEEVTIKIPD
jgi:hypothetical protein